MGSAEGLHPSASLLALYKPEAAPIIAAMKKRSPIYSTPDQTTIDFTVPAPEAVEKASAEFIAERATPEYSTAPGTKDMAGKTRTWVLYEPSGTKVAEITTKSGAEKIAAILNRAEGIKR